MFLEDYNCALCNEKVEETLLHLFWDCTFAHEYWNLIIPSKLRGISHYDEICFSLTELPADIALDIVLMGCWGIWSIRNDKIFRSVVPSLHNWLHYMNEGLSVIAIRAKLVKAQKIQLWIDS